MKLNTALSLLLLLFSTQPIAQDKTTIRIGALAFGTVNWELTALQNHSLDQTPEYILDITKLANPQAAKIALQSGAVDMIVSDWIWVSRQRAAGFDFTFYPYSNTAGSLIVPADSPIQSIADLKSIKLGIAGGELDKNWLLLQALAQRKQLDLNQSVDKIYGAPPLLNHQILQKNIDALITYWHYGARLEAQGYRQIIDGNELVKQLGIKQTVAPLGYVFNKSWGLANASAVKHFFDSVKTAKDLLCNSNDSWQAIASLTKAQDQATEKLLRNRYCQGRVKNWGIAEQQAAEQIYTLLRQVSQNRLTGLSEHIQPGTFWNP
jgi:NitT/TauT family transport system substrate-binding protein